MLNVSASAPPASVREAAASHGVEDRMIGGTLHVVLKADVALGQRRSQDRSGGGRCLGLDMYGRANSEGHPRLHRKARATRRGGLLADLPRCVVDLLWTRAVQ